MAPFPHQTQHPSVNPHVGKTSTGILPQRLSSEVVKLHQGSARLPLCTVAFLNRCFSEFIFRQRSPGDRVQLGLHWTQHLVIPGWPFHGTPPGLSDRNHLVCRRPHSFARRKWSLWNPTCPHEHWTASACFPKHSFTVILMEISVLHILASQHSAPWPWPPIWRGVNVRELVLQALC